MVLSDSDENEENEEKKIPNKVRKVSNKSCSRRLLIHRLFTVPNFRVISSRSSAVRYGLPSSRSVKTTNPRRLFGTLKSFKVLTVRRTISRQVIVDTTAAPALYIVVSILDRCVAF